MVKNAIDQQTKVAVDIEQLVASIKNSPETKRVFTEAAETAEGISAKRQKVENRMERLLTDLTEQIIDRNEYGYMVFSAVEGAFGCGRSGSSQKECSAEKNNCYAGMDM